MICLPVCADPNSPWFFVQSERVKDSKITVFKFKTKDSKDQLREPQLFQPGKKSLMKRKKLNKLHISEIHVMHNGGKIIFKPHVQSTIANNKKSMNSLRSSGVANQFNQEQCGNPGETRCKEGILQMCFPLFNGGPCYWFDSDPPSAC